MRVTDFIANHNPRIRSPDTPLLVYIQVQYFFLIQLSFALLSECYSSLKCTGVQGTTFRIPFPANVKPSTFRYNSKSKIDQTLEKGVDPRWILEDTINYMEYIGLFLWALQ